MNTVLEAGVKDGRVAMDWQELRFQDALNKEGNLQDHMNAYEYGAVACNAMILWWHFNREDIVVK